MAQSAAGGGYGGGGYGAGSSPSGAGVSPGTRQALEYQGGGSGGGNGAILDQRQQAVFEVFKMDGEDSEGTTIETVFQVSAG